MTEQFVGSAPFIANAEKARRHNAVRKPIRELKHNDEIILSWQSTAEHDAEWNAFVAQQPGGRHVQTSMWSSAKQLSGWQPLRLVLTKNDTVIGGCQILWRKKKLVGKIGFISHGPLCDQAEPALQPLVINELKRLVAREKLRALLVQPALIPETLSRHLNSANFVLNNDHLLKMIRADTIIDLSLDEEAILDNMRPHRRRNVRRNARRSAEVGLEFIEGGEADLQTAFDLMCQTCVRQGVAANPESVEILQHLWQLYHPAGMLKLFFMRKDEEKVSMCLMVGFRERALVWKIGWNGSFSKYSPNDLLHWECIKWAKSAGYRYFDFGGVDPEMAESILSLKSVEGELRKSTTFYKLEYGGSLIRYPEARVYFPNPLLRWAFMAYSTFHKKRNRPASADL